MVRVEISAAVSHSEEAVRWRRDQLRQLFPEMPEDQVEDLAVRGDRYVLAGARRLAADGCPAFLAYRILRD